MAPSALLLFLLSAGRSSILNAKSTLLCQFSFLAIAEISDFQTRRDKGFLFFNVFLGQACAKKAKTSERGGGATTGLPGSETGTEDEGVARIDGIRHKFRT